MMLAGRKWEFISHTAAHNIGSEAHLSYDWAF